MTSMHPICNSGSDAAWTELTFRPVGEDDGDLLLAIYDSSRDIELQMTGWGPDQRRAFCAFQLERQTEHYREHYPAAEHLLIEADGTPVGRIYFDRGKGEIAILDLNVLTEYRRRGIGTAVIRRLQAEASEKGHSVRIYVETYNPARYLLEREGFRAVEGDEMTLKFIWRDAKDEK